MDVNLNIVSTVSSFHDLSKSRQNSDSEDNAKTTILEDSYESSKNFVSSKEITDNMIKQAEIQTRNFEKLISSMLNKQANSSVIANVKSSSACVFSNLSETFSNIEVDENTLKKAQEAISEDGYYGVNQVSERILNFAKAASGDDLEKLKEMRKAVDSSFDNVKRLWGNELPDICKETYSKVMEGFDQLESEYLI